MTLLSHQNSNFAVLSIIYLYRNTLDGSHACFGYVTENQDLLEQLKANDKIVSMTVVDGSENLFMKKK